MYVAISVTIETTVCVPPINTVITDVDIINPIIINIQVGAVMPTRYIMDLLIKIDEANNSDIILSLIMRV